jgi:SAM-dependent methyltransferase
LEDKKAEFIPPILSTEKQALELGCASGEFLLRLREMGWKVEGVELVAEPASRARKRGLAVHTGTLETAAFPDAAFDAVFAWMVVEHLCDPKFTLGEVHRVLKPGGWFVFSVPNFGCWEPHVFQQYWYALDLPRHLHHFTPRCLTNLLSHLGFEQPRFIHQRSLLYVVGSLGFVWQALRPQSPLATRLIRFPDQPSLGVQLALAPFAKLLALMRQGGRLTVVTRRPKAS